jgi:hypothetical protein
VYFVKETKKTRPYCSVVEYKWDDGSNDLVDNVTTLKYGLRSWMGYPWWKLLLLNNSRRAMLRFLTAGNGKHTTKKPKVVLRLGALNEN